MGLKLSYAEAKIGILRLYQRYTFRLLPGQVRAIGSNCMTASALLCVYPLCPSRCCVRDCIICTSNATYKMLVHLFWHGKRLCSAHTRP